MGHIFNIVQFPLLVFKMQSSSVTSSTKSPWKFFSHFSAITGAALDLCNRKLVREISQACWQWSALGFGRGDIWVVQFCCTTTQKQLEIYIPRQVWDIVYGRGGYIQVNVFINMTYMSYTQSSYDNQMIFGKNTGSDRLNQSHEHCCVGVRMHFPSELCQLKERHQTFPTKRYWNNFSYQTLFMLLCCISRAGRLIRNGSVDQLRSNTHHSVI